MRVPVQAPAVARNSRSRSVRRLAGSWAGGRGVRPAQYDGEVDSSGGEEEDQVGDESGGEEAGEQGGEDSTVESD